MAQPVPVIFSEALNVSRVTGLSETNNAANSTACRLRVSGEVRGAACIVSAERMTFRRTTENCGCFFRKRAHGENDLSEPPDRTCDKISGFMPQIAMYLLGWLCLLLAL